MALGRRKRMRIEGRIPPELKTVRLSNLQMACMREFVTADGRKKILSLEDIMHMKQISIGSIRYHGWIEYVKECRHRAICECEGQGYQITDAGLFVVRRFSSPTDEIFKKVSDTGELITRSLSQYLREDIGGDA